MEMLSNQMCWNKMKSSTTFSSSLFSFTKRYLFVVFFHVSLPHAVYFSLIWLLYFSLTRSWWRKWYSRIFRFSYAPHLLFNSNVWFLVYYIHILTTNLLIFAWIPKCFWLCFASKRDRNSFFFSRIPFLSFGVVFLLLFCFVFHSI